ncbi:MULTISPECIES: hemerythrin domain-containing protein [unclassified Leptolyngbya]|uniref:hemerythrin domain-containing protein n=1 Tax=unclassified Leptolyngbya TaxID=2650499 RepID=UPI001683BB50|nr:MULTISPECIES: hemerythrin domain-containing protein [unclassified Leptolyngbya]MBD1910496.1 hemerythrin domain-containing protein [Leptolyngbya sp. FACHB-8]MBD2153663.1 hemerythrin domain-containing protein [Leptolyngbya sp. FACHB-16]
MTATLTDQKRAAIAEKLADMLAVQNLLIANEQRLLSEIQESHLRERLQDMLEDDQKNKGIIETVITQYGIQSDPKREVQQLIDQTQKQMQGSDISLYAKVTQHELLKHGQCMTGIVIHKAAQLVGADVEQAIAPLNTVNFENRAHQEQLKGVMEYVGTRELTGQEPDQSLWGRVQDALAAMTGVVGSAVTQSSDKSDMDITHVIFMDHQKAKTLMNEIKGSNDSARCLELFNQLYTDLLVHAKAEEQAVYPMVRSFYGENDTQDLYNEQAEMETLLNQIKAVGPNDSRFKDGIRQLREMVSHHTSQEENGMFPAIRRNLSEQQREQMATQFKEAKKQLQPKV